MPVKQGSVSLLPQKGITGVCVFKKKGDKKEEVGVIKVEKPVQRINSVPGRNPARLTLEIDGKTLVFDIDSGARDSFCSTRTWTKLGKPTLQTTPTQYITATGSSIPVLGTFRAKVATGRSKNAKQVIFNVSSLTHLNIFRRTAICDSEVDVQSLLKESCSDRPSIRVK